MKRHRPAELEQWTTESIRTMWSIAGACRYQRGSLVRTEARGYKTHGLTRVPSYIERLQTGVFNPRPHMRYQSTAGGTVVDADGQCCCRR